MESKLLNVFYDSSYLPYKDSERTVHFPIGGGTFAGSQNTFRIRFYPKDLVGGNDYVAQTSWVLVSKLPNGKLGYELLSTIGTDSVLGEKYIEFEMSEYYTQYKGVVKLALRGYQGEIEFVEDEDTGVYSVVGTPIIGVTGTIDIAINYSPMVYGEQLLPDELSQLVAKFSDYLSLVEWQNSWLNRIVVLGADIGDYSDYEEGQLFYRTDLNQVLELTFEDSDEGDLIPYNFGYLPFVEATAGTTTIAQIRDKCGSRPCVVNLYDPIHHTTAHYLVSFYTSGVRTTVCAFNLDNCMIIYSALQNLDISFSSAFSALISDTYKKTLATKDYVDDSLNEVIVLGGTSGTLSDTQYSTLVNNNEAQIKIGYNHYKLATRSSSVDTYKRYTSTLTSQNVVYLSEYIVTITHSNKNWVLNTITNNIPNTTWVDNAIASAISTLEQREFQKVNTTTYPTLNDFLASSGSEGYIYLYPIDPSDETKGFYQYIWENSAWLALGTTEIDLSDYYTKSQVDSALSGKVDKTQTIAGITLSGNISASDLANAINDELNATNETTDVDYIMGVE